MNKIIASKFRNKFNVKDDVNIIENEKSTKVFKDFNFENLTINEKDLIINENNNNSRKISIIEFVGLSDKKLVVAFYDCIFKELNLNDIPVNIIFQNCTINLLNMKYKNYKDRIKSLLIYGGEIGEINIIHTTIKSFFHINHINNKKIKIEKLYIKNLEFNSHFSISNAIIEEIEIKDVVFNSLSEFYKVEFKNKFNLSKIIYKDFTLFDKCIFNIKANFDDITFEKFTSFRGSIFNDGINLDYTSNKEEINFYDVQELDSKKSKVNTSQETYRIIKYQFEKLGNKIEANKYHALELEQKRKKLENEEPRNWQEYLVFKLHDLSSEHSTNWLYPILWSLAIAILTVIFVNIEIVIDLFFHPSHFKLEYIGKIWNEFWQYCYIGNVSDKLKDSPLVFLLNKGFLGYLYYQFLMSVRKDTRK